MEDQNNPSLSQDLTVIFLRGNGSPRTFRLSLPALQRSLTALGFFFALAIVAAVFLLLLNLFRFTPDQSSTTTYTPPAILSEPGKDDASLGQEVLALREDVARLNAIADGRKNLAPGTNPTPLQFFGPRNSPAESSPIQVKNLKVAHNAATKNVYVDFELHNIDPEQKLARGYILVLAKMPGSILSYPDGAFSTTQNIVLDFTKGETFGVSRFRQARAIFPAAPFEGKAARFQVLLFTNDGKVIADLHVEDTP